MKIKPAKIYFALSFLLIGLPFGASSQELPSRSELPQPKAEKFAKADELALPWRSSGCIMEGIASGTPCPFSNKEKYESSRLLRLYNEDGKLWYEFSETPNDPKNYWRNPKPSFEPMGSTGLVLRLVGIADHWYKVEINDRSGETKFILTSDEAWIKISWDYYWKSSIRTEIDLVKTPVFDGPAGKPRFNITETTYFFVETRGDWAKLKAYHDPQTPYFVWVKWREGREIKVACVMNSWKLP